MRHAKVTPGMGAAGAEQLADELAGAVDCQDDCELLSQKQCSLADSYLYFFEYI